MKGDESTRSWAHLIRVMKARGPGHIKELKTALGVLTYLLTYLPKSSRRRWASNLLTYLPKSSRRRWASNLLTYLPKSSRRRWASYFLTYFLTYRRAQDGAGRLTYLLPSFLPSLLTYLPKSSRRRWASYFLPSFLPSFLTYLLTKELKTALGVLVLTSQRFLAEGDDAELGCAAELRS